MKLEQPVRRLLSQCAVSAMTCCLLASAPGHATADELDALIQQLQSPEPFARLGAAGKIMELGPKAAAAVPALIEALKCERMDILFEMPQIAAGRSQFADALAKIGEQATADLLRSIQDDNGLVRVWSARALYRLDRERFRARVVPILTEALEQETEVASDAATVLEQMGEDAVSAISALIRQLEHREFAVRCNAAHALTAAVKPGQVDSLLTALQNSNPLVRVGAAFALQRVDAASESKSHPVITAALQSDFREARRQAVWAIGQLGVAAQSLAPTMITVLGKLEPDPIEYFFGGGGVGRLTADPSLVLVATGPGCKPELLVALESDESRVRVMAAVALMRLDKDQADRIAPILKAARADSDQGVRFLAEMNDVPASNVESQGIDELIKSVLATEDFGPPSPATDQLFRRGTESVGPLMEVLKRGDGLAARKVSGVLAAIGAPAMPALAEAMKSGNEADRVFAVGALAQMRGPAVPLLVEALNDELYPVRRAARYALRTIGTDEAREALRKSQDH
jgi:HEAT repeat protein